MRLGGRLRQICLVWRKFVEVSGVDVSVTTAVRHHEHRHGPCNISCPNIMVVVGTLAHVTDMGHKHPGSQRVTAVHCQTENVNRYPEYPYFQICILLSAFSHRIEL